MTADELRSLITAGLPCEHITKKEDVVPAIKRMLEAKTPYVLDIMVPYTEHVLPMIPGGMTYKDIITKPMVYSRSPVQTETGLTFSRFVRADTDLNAVISGIGEMMGEELKNDSIEIVMKLEELPPFRANGSQWSHVFTNLIANARDVLREHKTANPRITVTSSYKNGKVLATVADNGPGVPESHRHKIFEPFFSTKGQKGTGLGLSVIWGIIDNHNGTIKVESELNKGTTFRIRLPFEQPR